MDMLTLEMKVEDALFRIKDLYDRTNGKCIISFSGGKDSTVVAELYFMAKARGMIGNIDIVFADTKVEYDAIYDFVEWFNKNKQEVIYIEPTKPFGKVLKEYGLPAMSKMKSELLSTVHRDIHNPLKTVRGKNLLGYNEYKEKSHHRLANKHYHFLHPDIEYKISSKCCHFVKKQPFEIYYIKHGIIGYATGIRIEEGGIRALAYQSCTSFKMVKGVKLVHKLPIFDWLEKDVEEFIDKYNVKISEAYTKYKLDRTGCIGCPFARDIKMNLQVLHKYEPKKYKAVQHWLGIMYIDLDVRLDFDKEYMEKFNKRRLLLEERRYEMLEKYKPQVSNKYKPRPTLFDENNNKTKD